MSAEKKIYFNTEPKDFGPFEWFRHTCQAALTRTNEDIDYFIPNIIVSLTTLRCSTCSADIFKLIKKRHPNTYRNKKDARGENLGMWLWMFDLHNDVNEKLNKPRFSIEDAIMIYKPILSLTTEEITAQKEAAGSPQTMDNMIFITFKVDENDFLVDEIEVPDASSVITSDISTINVEDVKVPKSAPVPVNNRQKSVEPPKENPPSMNVKYSAFKTQKKAIRRQTANTKLSEYNPNEKCLSCGKK
jgi:hypothetical protein